MSRRVSLPGADELFRTTGGMALQSSSPRRGAEEPAPPSAPAVPSPSSSPESAVGGQRRPQEGSATAAGASSPRSGKGQGRGANRRPSGRERHDEKITVYVSAEELMDLEHARLVLRGEHGLAVDRGRIVREAVAVVLADLESRGDASILVRRLRGR
ncbi:hypothetical protein [Streptomyces sp. NPDC046161]|uniref:hypothetical protein n=1 Tax=Streptomyces sp. NPDC046161 TaxID=3155132 RepID=UPI0033EC7C30